jgi:hypothetical protein
MVNRVFQEEEEEQRGQDEEVGVVTVEIWFVLA